MSKFQVSVPVFFCGVVCDKNHYQTFMDIVCRSKLIRFRWTSQSLNGVLACSALKKKYRDVLLSGMPCDTSTSSDQCPGRQHRSDCNDTCAQTAGFQRNPVYFVYLKGSFRLIQSRLESRQDHFMPIKLLESQFLDLEEPSDGAMCWVVDIDNTSDVIVENVLARLHLLGPH